MHSVLNNDGNGHGHMQRSLFPHSSFVTRNATSLVELLVVIGIISVLMALIIPAVRNARGTARIASCANNLRQIGLALEMHKDNAKSYPTDGQNGYGIFPFLLPYLEQPTLHGRLQPSEQRPPNIAKPDLGGAVLSIFRCPSIGGEKQTKLGLGRSTYLGTSYLFPWKKPHAEIRDGTSNTIAVGEITIEQAWVLPGTAGAVPPNNDGLFASEHELGAHFLFCDGSVHFIDEAIDPDVFLALCTVDESDSVSGWNSPPRENNGNE